MKISLIVGDTLTALDLSFYRKWGNKNWSLWSELTIKVYNFLLWLLISIFLYLYVAKI